MNSKDNNSRLSLVAKEQITSDALNNFLPEYYHINALLEGKRLKDCTLRIAQRLQFTLTYPNRCTTTMSARVILNDFQKTLNKVYVAYGLNSSEAKQTLFFYRLQQRAVDDFYPHLHGMLFSSSNTKCGLTATYHKYILLPQRLLKAWCNVTNSSKDHQCIKIMSEKDSSEWIEYCLRKYKLETFTQHTHSAFSNPIVEISDRLKKIIKKAHYE